MVFRQLLIEWRARLRQWQGVAADPSQVWLASIRVRILSFLIRRYAEAAESAKSDRVLPASPLPTPKRAWTICEVVVPDGPPPRSADDLRTLLLDIRRCNVPPLRRRWFRWG